MLRFAPSPNGPLHLGHALSALVNEAMAERLGRALLLRMEDIDLVRCRAEYEIAILDDLAWLGIAWTPPVRRQSDRFAPYADALALLRARGLVYPSFTTRREIAEHASRLGLPRDPDGAPRFAGDAPIIGEAERRRRARNEPAAWRLDMARAVAIVGEGGWTELRGGRGPRRQPADPLAWGDVILARRDVPTSYHLSVVVDDADEGITHVVRGEDLFEATSVHRVLQALLGLPEPVYHHHGLILGPDGRKLSKSNGGRSLASLRAEGLTAPTARAEAFARAVTSPRRSPATS